MLLDSQSELVETTGDEGHRQRGPLRPEQLLSARQRQSRRLSGHRFRAIDTLFVVFAMSIYLQRSIDDAVLETPLADVIPVAVGGWMTWWLLRSFGLYRLGRSEDIVAHLAQVFAAALLGAGVAVLVQWIVPAEHIGRADVLELMAICGGGLVILHATWCALVARWRSGGWLTPNLVVVGATDHAEDLISSAIERRDMNILGIFDDRPARAPRSLRGVPVLGTTEALLRHRVMPYVDLIVVTIDPTATARVRQIVAQLSVLPNRVTLLFDDSATDRRSAAIEQLADAPLEPLHPTADAARRAFAKRIQDLAISVPILIAAAPFLAMIALAVRLDSPGPIFFRQRRHGFNNEEIVVWKFRTMRQHATDATAARAERQVTAGDHRVTRVGRFLRKTSLDEVPQLFNVITGEMSLVGPRPHAIGMKTREVESAQLVAEYAHRHRIKPGMTGWAAIKGSRGPMHDPEDVSRRVALDVDYIEHQSFWLDLKIMLMTLPSMFGDRHAVR
jgi:Undecaprenyl-phosphate glucose phosphotransferase